MRTPRSLRLLDKSVAAMVCAIEAYNKPDHKYREETFAILSTNAWELLFKAKILRDHDNDVRKLYLYEPRRAKAGGVTKKKYVKKNRSGTPFTISLGQAMESLRQVEPDVVDQPLRDNVLALVEVRDSSTHFMNSSAELTRVVLEIGTATIQNYLRLCRIWFDRDLSEYALFLMPIGFVRPTAVKAVPIGSAEKSMIEFIGQLQASNLKADSENCFALGVDISFSRTKDPGTPAVRITKDPSAPEVRLTDEQFLDRWPWDFSTVVEKLRERYSDFVQNKKFYDILALLKEDEKYARSRHLNPRKVGSTNAVFFYSTSILNVFDQHYTRR